MPDKTLQRVTSSFMQDLYEKQEDVSLNDSEERCEKNWWADNDLLFIRRVGERSSRVFGSGGPFQLDQLHIGLIMSGEQDVTVNLRQYHLSRGSVLMASPESIMQQGSRSDDLDMQVIHLSDSLLLDMFKDKVPPLFAHRMTDQVFHIDEPTSKLLLTMLDALWQSIDTPFITSRNNLLESILNLMVTLSLRDEQYRQRHQPRGMEVLNRFVSLVAEHCDSQRTLDFYADKLCLSKQYLGSLIREQSHRSASQWIEEATLARIKVMLLHSDASLSEISERMSFPEPSHFSRYFKRLTGLTPNEYRTAEGATFFCNKAK